MAITLPPDLASIFAAVSGMAWPQANEDDLRTAGDDYQTIADDIPKLKEYIVEIVNICLARFEGDAADAFVASMRELIGQTGGTDYLGEAAKQAGELAGVAHDTANQVEYTKWMVIGQLVMLLAEILFDIFWAPFTFGESLLNITWEWALVREAIQIIFKWLLKSIAMHTFTGVAQSLLLDGVIQGVQFAQGHRHEWDSKATLQAFEFGLITGLVSGPLDLAGMGLGKMIGGAIGKSAGSIVGHELGGAMKDTLGHAGKGALEGGVSAAGKWLDDAGSKAFARDIGKVMGAALPQIRQGFTKFGEGTIAQAFEDRFARIFERHLRPVLGEETAETLGRDFGRTFAKEWRDADAEVGASLRRLLHETPVSDTGVRALADTLPELAQHMNEGNTMFTVGHAIGEQLKEGALNNLSEGFYNLIFSDDHQFTSTWATFGSGVAMGLLGRVGHHLASPISARFADYVANWQHAPIHEGDSRYFGPLHPLTVLSLASNLAGHPAPFPVPRLGPHTAEASDGPAGGTVKTSSGGPGRHGFDSDMESLLGSAASVRTESSLDSPRTSISSGGPDVFGPHETTGGHEGVEPPEAVRTHSRDDTVTATTPEAGHAAATDRTGQPPPGTPVPRPVQSADGPAPVPHDPTPGPPPVPDHIVPAPPHAEAPRVDLPTGVWFPRAHSTPRHEVAARAVPGADGWRLVVGHGSPGTLEIGGMPVNAETALTHIGTGDRLTFATCYAAKPGDDGHSLALDTHLRTGKETLGPTHEAIVTTGGEVISGVFGIDQAGRQVVMPTGDWVVFRDGVPHSLDTPSLKEAYAKLGAQEKAGGPAPDEAVGFVYGISAAQHEALAQYGYAAPTYPSVEHPVPDPGRADSFFTSLHSMAENDLRPYFGRRRPTPARIRQAMHTALRSDLTGANPRYDRFLTPGQDVNHLLASLADPTQWTPQLGELAPHLAADLFNLRLGVVGASGRPEHAGLVMGRSRIGHADGNPYLLVRVGDNHFVPTVRTGGPALAVPRSDQVHDLPNTSGHETWTRPLTSDEQRLVDQAGEDAIRHPAVEPRVGPQTTLAHARATVAYLHDAISAPDGVLATNLRTRLHDLIRRALTGDPTAVDGLETLERVAYHHEMSTTGGPMDETRYIWRIQQMGAAEGTPISNDDARTAARAHAYHELGDDSVRNARGIPLPAGTGIRSRIDALSAAARHAMDTAGTRARDDLVTARQNAVPPPRIHPDTPAEARDAAMAVHRRRLDEIERDARTAGGPADRAERAAREPALRQHVDSFYTPQELDRMRWALLAYGIPNHIASAEQAGTDAAARIVDTLQAPARSTAEWEIRADAARHEQLMADPPRQLPAGFGERDADGRRQYPMGYRGRLMRLGDDWFGDDTAIANLVSGHAPVGADAGLQNAINTAVREHLTRLGNRAVAQRMLEGGLRFSVTSGGERHEVRVLLHLGEPPRAHYLPAFESQRDERDAPASQQTPLGQKHHGAVESDHERIAGTRKAGSTSRSMAVNVNVTSPFGVQPARIFSGGAEVGLDAESGKGWSHGSDGVSATKRFLDVAGKESHFDFPGARLTVQVRRDAADRAPRTHTAMLPARFGFPKELTPRQPAGGGPALPDPAARRGAGNPFHGVTPDQLRDGTVAAPDTADRVHDVLGTVLHIPESISGLGTLRDQLIKSLPHPVEAGSDLYDGIQHWISEPNLLRNYGEMTTIGTLSPAYRTGDGDTSAYLTVTSKMLGAQRVGPDPVPMKEESQRWVNTNSSTSESGSFGITPIKGNIGYTIGDPTASYGFNHSLGLGGSVGAKLSTTRSSNENTGAGEVRGLVYDGPSVLYRLTTRMTVAVTSDAEGYANDDRPLATHDVTTFARVPIHEAPRFEALIDREAAGPVDSAAWRSVRVPRDLDPRPADPIALQAMITAENTPRHPPASIEAGQGIGFSAIGRLSGSEKVIPEIEATLKKVEYSRAWIPDWAPMELKHLRHQLLAKFSKEGLINRGSALFQPGGVKERLHRPVDGGTEVITITVKAKKLGTVPVAGRVANTKLELMPAGFAGESGSDSLLSTLSGAGNLGFTAGIGGATGDRLRQFGFSFEGSAGSGKSASTSVGASGFQIQAMLYGGPARTFDYNVRYEVTVGVRYRSRPTAPGDWPKIAYNWLKGNRSTPDTVGGAAGDRRVTGGEAAITSVLQSGHLTPHQVRFVVPENLAPVTRIHHPNVGRLTKHDYPIPPPRPANKESWGKPIITLPDLPPVVKNAHTPLNGDDIVMETIGSEHLEREVGELLARVGVDPVKTGDITWVATGTEMLTGAQVRGPSSITATMVAQGIIRDENTVIRIEGFPVRGAATPQGLTTLRMDVAEGGGNVSGSHGSSMDSAYKVGVNFGALAGENGGSQQVFPGINRGGDIPWMPRSASSHTTALGPVSGRLTQVTEPYLQHKADMAYRITVVNQAKNMLFSDLPRVAGSVVEIAYGIHYLRSSAGHVDPHDPHVSGAINPAPGGKPTLIRTALPPRGGLPGPRQRRVTDKIIQTFPATPHDRDELNAGRPGRRLPTNGLVPHAAASERLLVRPTAGPHFDITGEGNPLLAGVQRLLQNHAPAALEDYWQIVGTGAKQRPVPTKLANLLNVGSAEALIDTMLGPGLILHTTKSGFLHNDRVWLLLRARRDPEDTGYYHLENIPQANVARYHFRTNRSETGRSRPRGFEWSSGTKAAENPANAGRFSSGSVNPSASLGHSSSEGGAVAKVDASRNTLFVGGDADRYAGDLGIDMVVLTTSNPSRLLNTTFFTLPDKVSMVLHDKLDMSKVDGRESTTLTERVLIPQQLLKPDIQEYIPHANDVAVSEVPFGSTSVQLGGVPLPVTDGQLMDRSVLNLGLDPDKLQVLSDEVFKRLGGNVPIDDHSFDSATARMAAHGSRARDAIYTMLSAPMMTNELEFMVGPDGLVSPPLVREGGPFTDTHAKVTIKAELFDPRIRNYFNGSLESNSYHFIESNKNKSDGDSWGLGNSSGFTGISGSTDPQPPGSHAAQKPGGALTFGVKQSTTDSSFVVHKDMPRVVSRNRTEPWLRVKSDVLLKITVEARNQRGPLDYPGGTTRMAFHIRNGVELAFSPDHALRTFDVPALHAHGVPTPSGVLIPAKNFAGVHDDGMSQLQAAFTFPAIQDALVVHVHGDPAVNGNFVVGGQSMTPVDFSRTVLDRHGPRAGQYLVFVGCRVNRPINGGPSAAEIIATRYPGVCVIGTQGVALTTSSGPVLTGVFTGNGLRPRAIGWKGDWILTEVPVGQPPNVVHLGHDLIAALRTRGLGIGPPPGGSLPPTRPVVWGGGSSGTANGGGGADDGAAPGGGEDPLVMPPSDWTSVFGGAG